MPKNKTRKCKTDPRTDVLPGTLLGFSNSSERTVDTMIGCWRWEAYIKGTGWTTRGWITGSIPGLLSPWRERAAMTGGIVKGIVKGCIPGGPSFFIGGLDEGRFNNPGGDLRGRVWNLKEEGEFPADGGELRLFMVRSTGSTWTPLHSPSGIW